MNPAAEGQPVPIRRRLRLYEIRDWAAAPHIYLLVLPLLTGPATLFLLNSTDLCYSGATSEFPHWSMLPGLLNLLPLALVFGRGSFVRTHALQATVLGLLRLAFPLVNHDLSWGTNTALWLVSFWFLNQAYLGKAYPRLVWASAIVGGLAVLGAYLYLPVPDFWWECWEAP